jgi:alanyl-tRNA synthetase
VTGDVALEHILDEEHALRDAAQRLNVAPAQVGDRVEHMLAELKAVRGELEAQKRQQTAAEAPVLAANAVDGVVIERRDGLTNDELRQLAIATRDVLGSGIVGLVGVAPDADKAAVVVAVSKDLVQRGVQAGAIAADAAKALGGGTGRQPDVAVGGGPDASAVEEARTLLTQRAKEAAGAEPGRE